MPESCYDPVTHRPRLLSGQCATCIFLPGNPMHLRPGRLKTMVTAGLRQDCQGIICHDTLSYGDHPGFGPALCRGFYDAYGPQSNFIRVIERIGGFTEVDPPGENEMTDPVTDFRGSYSFLSNFARSPIDIDGWVYMTAEHAFQAQKASTATERMMIQACRSALDAKRAGRRLRLSPDWDGVRKRVMFDVVLAKFWQNPRLGDQLVSTGDAGLIEGNWWHDQFWGDCRCSRPSCAEPGLNYLGQILTWVRAILREDKP